MPDNTNNLSECHDSEKESKPDKYLWLGFPVVILIWLVYGYFQGFFREDSSFDRLNTLFSGLAFWGVIWAILLQKRELGFQRNELELTRREVRGQKEQLEAQNITLRQQRFENTFFSLLDLFTKIVDSMELTRSPRLGETVIVFAKGRVCFSFFMQEFASQYSSQRDISPDLGHRTLCVNAYDRFADSRLSLVGHYFRTLYNIVKIVERSDIENKQTYVNLLRAQLSSSELTLLFYNCISKYGSEKFMPLIQKYGLLKNMDFSSLIDPKHRELFKESAFNSPT